MDQKTRRILNGIHKIVRKKRGSTYKFQSLSKNGLARQLFISDFNQYPTIEDAIEAVTKGFIGLADHPVSHPFSSLGLGSWENRIIDPNYIVKEGDIYTLYEWADVSYHELMMNSLEDRGCGNIVKSYIFENGQMNVIDNRGKPIKCAGVINIKFDDEFHTLAHFLFKSKEEV